METQEFVLKTDDLVRQIKPILSGQGPEAQGAVVAELAALWLAGHNPALREGVLDALIEVIDRLVPLCEVELFGTAGYPQGSA